MSFDLPEKFIAQHPAEPRDHCKLMVLDKEKKTIKHDRFFHLGQYLRKGDVLVFNQSKVLPARLIGYRGSLQSTHASKRELLLLKDLGGGKWQCLIGGKIKMGDVISFDENLQAEILFKEGGTSTVQFTKQGVDFFNVIQKIGLVPTPPYIKQFTGDPDLYQTVYANTAGSAAAPTAGLHFTDDLLDQLKKQGIQQEFVTLHVGLGTFQPIKTEIVEEHPIHSEYYEVGGETFERLKKAKEEGRRIIAVGTTSVRVVETIFNPGAGIDSATGIVGAADLLPLQYPLSGETNIFIYPGYEFKAVDALITNFHTPYSSLLALVYTLAGREFILQAYEEAKKQDYRFFSFGDAMLIF